MNEISEIEARRLIVSGESGYWGIHACTVVLEHDEQFVIRLDGKCFLAPASEFGVKFCGEAGVIGGKVKGAFVVEIKNEEIETLARQELAQRGHFL